MHKHWWGNIMKTAPGGAEHGGKHEITGNRSKQMWQRNFTVHK